MRVGSARPGSTPLGSPPEEMRKPGVMAQGLGAGQGFRVPSASSRAPGNAEFLQLSATSQRAMSYPSLALGLAELEGPDCATSFRNSVSPHLVIARTD